MALLNLSYRTNLSNSLDLDVVDLDVVDLDVVDLDVVLGGGKLGIGGVIFILYKDILKGCREVPPAEL